MQDHLTKEELTPTVITIQGKESSRQIPAWLVPGTDGLFAIDQRFEADVENGEPAYWAITHVPTGFAVRKSWYTDACDRAEAIAVATAFYRESKARNFPLTSTDPQEVVAAHNSMEHDEKQRFWEAISRAKL
jgi:hypothetical protein